MRLKNLCNAAFVVPIVMSLNGCATPSAQAPVAESPPAFRHAVNINDVMVSIVDHNSHALWNIAVPKTTPKTEADWHELEHASVTLAASGSMISVGGSGPDDAKWAADPEWRRLAQNMTDAALKAKLAVDNKNIPGVLAAGDDLVATCESCHAKFKPAIPAHVATKDHQPEHFGH